MFRIGDIVRFKSKQDAPQIWVRKAIAEKMIFKITYIDTDPKHRGIRNQVCCDMSYFDTNEPFSHAVYLNRLESIDHIDCQQLTFNFTKEIK